ncbi:MAG: HD domain-containing protein [Candidatus Falkowbacteria bacterium]|nr:HD domain-containing protein [Candidatus Falkowbacteria bacterium]
MKEVFHDIANNSNKPNSVSEDARVFSIFENHEDGSGKIIVKKFKPLEEILSDLEKVNGQDEFPHVQNIIDIFNNHRAEKIVANGEAVADKPHLLIVGGFIRDLLLHKKPKDIDFTTDLELKEVEKLLSDNFSEEIANKEISIDETGKSQGVIRIKFKDDTREVAEEYEIASFRKDSDTGDGRRPDSVELIKVPGIDAQRRDFTINAVMYNPKSHNIIDYTGGLKDLDDKKLRFVGDPKKRITEDRSRALRYIRFLFKTNFSEDKEAKIAIQEMSQEISQLPAEMILKELKGMLEVAGDKPGKILEYFKEFGLLEKILPEISDLEKCPQGPPYHMEGDVFKHTVMVLNNLPANSSLELFLAATMHDIAKPDTRKEGVDKKVSFHSHDLKGSEKVAPILKRLKLPNKSQDKITKLIANHIKIFSFLQMKNSKAIEMAKSPDFKDQITLLKADNAGTEPADKKVQAETNEMIEKIIERYEKIIDDQAKFSVEREVVRNATNGNKIIQLYSSIHGRKPLGKNIGIIEAQIKELIDDENIVDKTLAQEKLKDIITNFKEQ